MQNTKYISNQFRFKFWIIQAKCQAHQDFRLDLLIAAMIDRFIALRYTLLKDLKISLESFYAMEINSICSNSFERCFALFGKSLVGGNGVGSLAENNKTKSLNRYVFQRLRQFHPQMWKLSGKYTTVLFTIGTERT